MSSEDGKRRKIYTTDTVLFNGLLLVGFDADRQKRAKRSTNLQRFIDHFGSRPNVYAQMIADMQTTDIEEARVDEKFDLENFLMGIHFLKIYPRQSEQESTFKCCKATAKKWAWFYARKIQAMKRVKVRALPDFSFPHRRKYHTTNSPLLFLFIPCMYPGRFLPNPRTYPGRFLRNPRTIRTASQIVWPEKWTPINPGLFDDTTEIYLVSVDGVHCKTHEFYHPTSSKNPKLYSHKFNQAALAYEVALSLWENKCVHINGPFQASVHDKAIFTDDGVDADGKPKGLQKKMPKGKKAIGDNGYRGHPGVLSTPNTHDAPAVRSFKGRARARQEAFNARLKVFRCLEDTFRHDMELHQICFEAVAVICQYQLENGSPLFEAAV